MGVPGGSDGKESACNAGGPGWIPGWGRSPGGGSQRTATEKPGSLLTANECGRQRRDTQPWGERKSCQEGKGFDLLLEAALLQVVSGAGGLSIRLR